MSEIIVQRPSYMHLAKLREEAEEKAAAKSRALERSLQILLEHLAKYCKLEGHSDRFSVYYYHENQFVMLARSAKNPNFAKKGRGHYPIDQGAIGTAWAAEHGQALVQMSANRETWDKAARRQNFTDDDIARMRMRAKTVAALRIEGDKRSVGVLVIETTTPSRITQAHLDLASDAYLVAAIGELVAAAALLTPEGETLGTPAPRPVVRPWLPIRATVATRS
ncbi:GAF domain-containing protein [Plantibacter elymi (nom. nud.)]|uniref:GAF domain-containing protein n=1 Tax=Plantibacter elymi (nom. nud.) TaxID=199708 RepID=UPI0010555FFB|nr:GAF domain-containing protein [Plantibacter sp. VKM Ac-1784]